MNKTVQQMTEIKSDNVVDSYSFKPPVQHKPFIFYGQIQVVKWQSLVFFFFFVLWTGVKWNKIKLKIKLKTFKWNTIKFEIIK